MQLETYQNAIKKIEDDPLSFMFCSHATKRERQLSKFREAVEHLRALDGWRCPECDTVNADDVPVCECGYSKSSRK